MPTLYTEQKKYSDFLFVSRSILPSVQATKIWGSCHNFKCLKLVLKGPRLKLFARLKLSAPTVEAEHVDTSDTERLHNVTGRLRRSLDDRVLAM
jgi:hypothetical protein